MIRTWLILGCLAVVTAPAIADDSAVLLTASDLLSGSKKIAFAKPGTYTVKAWATGGRKWSLTTKDNVATLESSVVKSGPGWSTVGKFEQKQPGEIELKFKGFETQAPRAATKSRKATPDAPLPPLPTLLTLSTDEKFTATDAASIILPQSGTIEDDRASQIRTNEQGADFRAPATAQAWRDRAKSVREALLVSLGLWPMPPKTDLHPRVFDKIDRDGYTIEKVVIETLPGFTLSGNLYRPKNVKGRIPLVLCPHGHWSDGRVNPEVQPRCVRWAQLGCAVFLYDMVGYNDTKAFGHEFLNDRLRRWGFSLVTLQTWNSIRALDFLLTLPDIDSARVACTGESGGGTQTFLLTAIDDRVKFAAPIVMVSDSFQGGCVCENAAGLRIGTDNVEFAALAAPRPMKLVGATGDWTAKTMSNAYPTLRRIYELVGDPDDLSADVFDFPHNYNETSRNAVYAFLAPRLLGIDSAKTKEGPVKIEEPATLWTHGEKDPRTDLKTPAQLESELILMQSRQIDRLAPGTTSSPWEAGRALLKRAIEVRTGINTPTPFDIDVKPSRRSKLNGLAITHDIIGRKGTGEQIPVVRIDPEKPSGRVTIVFSTRGKAELTNADGKPSPLAAALLERGHSVVGFDPLFVGESLNSSSPVLHRPRTAHYDTYNPTLAADRLQDLATVVAWTQSRKGVNEVNLAADGEAAVLALVARPVLGGIVRTSLDLNGFDYGDGSASIPAGLDLPGVLQFGGLKVAAALVSPAPLWLAQPGQGFDAKWPTKAYALEDASSLLRLDDKAPNAKDRAAWLDSGDFPK